MSGFDVIVCGSLHYDVVVNAPRLPGLDETLPGSAWQPVFGGKGRNQAVAAQLLGAKTAMIGRVGDDDFGKALAADLEASGVSTRHVATDPEAGSGMSVAIVDEAGDYGAVIVSGANLGLDAGAVSAAMADLRPARIGVFQNEVPAEANLAFACACRAASMTTIYNAAPARVADPALVANVDILIVNRVEARMMGAANDADMAEAARSLAETGRTVIATLGGEGCIIADTGHAEHIPAHAVEVVSTHGAGDAFAGALAARLAGGADIKDAATFANAAASRIVATPPEARHRLSFDDFT